MRVVEVFGRATFVVLKPFVQLAIKNSRRAYVVVEHDGKILVVKNILGNGKWHLPGGGCHGSESYAVAAARELYEEVGVRVKDSDLLQVTNEPLRSRVGFEYVLHSFAVKSEPVITIDKFEILEATWLAPSELNKANSGDATLEAVAFLYKY